jgi:hypothetical protein
MNSKSNQFVFPADFAKQVMLQVRRERRRRTVLLSTASIAVFSIFALIVPVGPRSDRTCVSSEFSEMVSADSSFLGGSEFGPDSTLVLNEGNWTLR